MFIVVEKEPTPAACASRLDDALRRIRSTADYQFGKGVGVKLFPRNVRIVFSRNTGRIRYVLLGNERLATLRPTDGLFSLGLASARRIIARARCRVTVKNSVSRFIAEGGDVFSVHVLEADHGIRAQDEVIVADEEGTILAVGRAFLSADEMKVFKRGVAVKVRRGTASGS